MFSVLWPTLKTETTVSVFTWGSTETGRLEFSSKPELGSYGIVPWTGAHRGAAPLLDHSAMHRGMKSEDIEMSEPNLDHPSVVFDTLLFVAVPAEEKGVKEVAESMKLTLTSRRGNFAKYLDLGTVGQRRVGVVRTDMGPFGTGGSAAQAIRCRVETQATSLIGLGMAFGASPQMQHMNDVLVSSCLLPYDYRTVRCSPGSGVEIDYSSVRPFGASEPLKELFARFAAQAPEWQDKAHVGPMLTGAARIHCEVFRDELVRELSNHGAPVIGGEMEGMGLLASGSSWIVVKGICDFADHERDSIIASSRLPACVNAARFVLSALRWEGSINGTT